MLKDKSQQLSFEDKWPQMRPTILKLLRQEVEEAEGTFNLSMTRSGKMIRRMSVGAHEEEEQ